MSRPTANIVQEGDWLVDASTGEIAPAPPAPADLLAGASPSNTAPANCTTPLARIFLTGIDSLYVSYRGTVNKDWEARLLACKEAAQSEEPNERLQAQLEIAGNLFLVHDKGAGRFA